MLMAVEQGVSELQSLRKLNDIEAAQWLTPSPSRSELARTGAKHIFSLLKSYAPKSPFDELLVNGFDAEQIWQQIDLQSQPVLASIRREVNRYERNPDEISKLFGDRVSAVSDKVIEDVDDDMRELDDEEEEEEDEELGEDERNEEESGSEEEEEDNGQKGRFEDKFLKLDELEEYLEKDEEREYGVDTSHKKKSKKGKKKEEDSSEDEEEEDEGESDEEEDELDLFRGGADEDDDELGDAKYDDFFGSNKKKEVKRKSDLIDGSEDSETDEEEDEEGEDKIKKLSTFQKENLKRQAQIAELEKEMLEPKTWTMQGEVTATQRSKNSALEVDLDFERNVRPAPVITEEVTVSIEDMIKKRILEGRFDDVQKPPGLPTKAPRERKELDETKSKKGLGEIYEDEYVQKTNPDAPLITFSDEQKKEASMIFKTLCVKLDALSHFHFAPKPVIEDMSIQSNLPALAMEEVAPVAVSDAAMLAPEEVYDGKGDFKEEAELTQAERKRRRANKKRKFKAVAAKHGPKRSKDSTVSNDEGKSLGKAS
uniref:U3 small nucleolar ribonucleoprotein protein MPP10 n=1 Tax=Kalanchoe fedtschenkoi TaxID=63787 RepID=A0A7N0VN40_KALFE